MLQFAWLRKGFRSGPQVYRSFVFSTALWHFHWSNPPSLMLWRRPQCCLELLLLLHHGASPWRSPTHIYSIFSWHAQHSTKKLEDLTFIRPAGIPWAPTQNQEAQIGGNIGLSHLQLPIKFHGSQPCKENPPVLYKWITFVEQQSKLMEVPDAMTGSSQSLRSWHQW